MSLREDYERIVKRDAMIVAYPKSCKKPQKCHVIPDKVGEPAENSIGAKLFGPNRVFRRDRRRWLGSAAGFADGA